VLRSRRSNFARAIAVAALLAPAIAVTVANAQTPVWHAAQPIPQGANEVIGTALDDAVFVYGGQIDGTNVPQGLFFMFGPSTGSWTRLPSNPVPVHHAALVAVGQRVYLIGGFMLPSKRSGGVDAGAQRVDVRSLDAALVRACSDARGDWLVYYSPRTAYPDGPALQAFTAIGEVIDDAPEQVAQTPGFHPYRRRVRFLEADEAPIAPLLDSLSFTRDKTNWGISFRRSYFQIPQDDFILIERAMQATE